MHELCSERPSPYHLPISHLSPLCGLLPQQRFISQIPTFLHSLWRPASSPTHFNPTPRGIRYYGTQNTNSHSYTLLSTRQQGEQDTLQHKTTRMLINGLSLLATSVRRLFGYGALQHQQLRVMIVPSERDITN